MMLLIPIVWMRFEIRLVEIFPMFTPKQDFTLNYIFDLTWNTSNGHFTPKLFHSRLCTRISLKMIFYFTNMILQNELVEDNFHCPTMININILIKKLLNISISTHTHAHDDDDDPNCNF